MVIAHDRPPCKDGGRHLEATQGARTSIAVSFPAPPYEYSWDFETFKHDGLEIAVSREIEQ